MYTLYDTSANTTVDASITLPDYASPIAATPTNVTGVYASVFNTPLVFEYTTFGGSTGEIGPASDVNQPFGIVNDVIQLAGQVTSPVAGTYGNVLLRINGSIVTRAGVLLIAATPVASVPEPASAVILGAGLMVLCVAMGRQGRASLAEPYDGPAV